MEIKFAGFWIRFVAYIIDKIIVLIIQSVLIIPFTIFFGFLTPLLDKADSFPQYTSALYAASARFDDYSLGFSIIIVLLALLFEAVGWLYFALMESSPKQATLGKAAVGIIVTDENYERISFLRATARYFSKIISSFILMLGFIMAGFTRRKQALHDFIAGTFVIYNQQSLHNKSHVILNGAKRSEESQNQ